MEDKTDVVEIFQSIRAVLQPYTTLGFNNRKNSDTEYDLWSEKNVELQGEQKHETFFSSVVIKDNHVDFNRRPNSDTIEIDLADSSELLEITENGNVFHIKKLSPDLLKTIEDLLAAEYRVFKEKEWV